MWRAAAAAVLVVLSLTDCQSQQASVTASPRPTGAVSPGSSPSAVASPLPPVASSLACRLPISDATAGSGGFITFPGGQFAIDPSSQVSVPGNGAGGRTAFGLSYDRGFHKWLPVPWDWVSPDGSRYVYPASSAIEVVGVQSGRIIQELTKAVGGHWWPLDVENTGVWAIQVYDSSVPAPMEGGLHLYLFPYNAVGRSSIRTNPESGFTHFAVRGSIGYDTYDNWVAPGAGSKNQLLRSNYGNGQATVIFNSSDSAQKGYTWVGVASDIAFLIVDGGLIALPGANPVVTRVDMAGDLPRVGLATYSVLGDVHGIWIAGKSGVYLMTSSGVQGASAKTGALAGSCG